MFSLVQCIVMVYSEMKCSAVHCCTVKRSVVHCFTVKRSVVHCFTAVLMIQTVPAQRGRCHKFIDQVGSMSTAGLAIYVA